MNKKIKYYSVIWLISLAIFNVVAFITPSTVNGVSKYDASFWIGYGFITATFIGQLYCAYKAFKANSLQRLFYNVSLISVSYIGLIVMLIVGSLCMTIPQVPCWIGVIACVLVLGVTAIAVIKTSAAIEIVESIDEKVKAQTFFIKSLTMDADGLVTLAKTAEMQACAKTVYEAIRYSDPMTNPALTNVEAQIVAKFEEFSKAVGDDNIASAKDVSNELLLLIRNRNQKCKLLK